MESLSLYRSFYANLTRERQKIVRAIFNLDLLGGLNQVKVSTIQAENSMKSWKRRQVPQRPWLGRSLALRVRIGMGALQPSHHCLTTLELEARRAQGSHTARLKHWQYHPLDAKNTRDRQATIKSWGMLKKKLKNVLFQHLYMSSFCIIHTII